MMKLNYLLLIFILMPALDSVKKYFFCHLIYPALITGEKIIVMIQ